VRRRTVDDLTPLEAWLVWSARHVHMGTVVPLLVVLGSVLAHYGQLVGVALLVAGLVIGGGWVLAAWARSELAE
jgi:hypothetical protein